MRAGDTIFRADFRFASSQWETALLCNDVSHWVGANLKPALILNEVLHRALPLWEDKPVDYMMTSSNGNIFRVTGLLCGEFTGPGEFPAHRPVTRSFDVFFDLRLNKRLIKQPWGWWFETPSWSLWRQCNIQTNWRVATSPPLSKIVYVFKGWFVILCYITVKSVWWLLMTWRPNDTRPSAITMITSTVGCALHIRSAIT